MSRRESSPVRSKTSASIAISFTVSLPQRFRRGSKSYQAARYIVQHEDEIDEENKEIIASEINMAPKTLAGVFSKLRKLGLYGMGDNIDLGGELLPDYSNQDEQDQPEIPQQETQVAQHQPQNPQVQYVTFEDFDELKDDISNNINRLISAINGEDPEGEAYLDDRLEAPAPPQEMTIEDPSLMRKTIWFKPKATMYYDLAKQGVFHTYVGSNDIGPLSRFNGNLSDFVNMVIDDYFVRNYNADIGLLMRRYV